MPAYRPKRSKDVTPEQRDEIIRRIAHDYRMYASWYEEEDKQ